MEVKNTTKRRREDDSVYPNTYRDGHIKKVQQHKIYSEAHQRTIQMMMEAQKFLQKKMHAQEDNRESDQEGLKRSVSYNGGNYRQTPHWPCITKVRN